MTLSELADFACAKTGQTDEESLAQCKRFLDARLRMIWDSAPWRDSLCLASASVAAGARWLLLPVGIERVLKLRAGAGAALAPLDGVSVFDYTPDLFEEAGEPVGFAAFAPAVHGPSATGEDSPVLTQTDGLSAPQDLGKQATIEVEQANGRRVIENVASAGAAFPFTCAGVFIVRLSKEKTVGAYQAGFLDGQPLTEPLGAGETQFPRRPRVRLLRRPPAGTTVLALCKRGYPGLVHDWEAPALSNVENALLAYATADLLERQRQYGKAEVKLKEAREEMALLHDLERNQSASECRIIPG